MQFCTPTTNEITHAESFFVRLHAARRTPKKDLSARRRSSGLSAWNADWLVYRISPSISPCLQGLFDGPIWEGDLSTEGTYMMCKEMFSENKTQHSQFANLNSKSNVVFDNNLNNHYI